MTNANTKQRLETRLHPQPGSTSQATWRSDSAAVPWCLRSRSTSVSR